MGNFTFTVLILRNPGYTLEQILHQEMRGKERIRDIYLLLLFHLVICDGLLWSETLSNIIQGRGSRKNVTY